LQSYDIISKVVSVAYGKFSNEKKSETAANQRLIKNHLLDPMENFRYRYGKRAKKWLLLKKKSAKKQSPAAGIVLRRDGSFVITEEPSLCYIYSFIVSWKFQNIL
jgi:hypothetical protein